jgi:hypothetical protein
VLKRTLRLDATFPWPLYLLVSLFNLAGILPENGSRFDKDSAAVISVDTRPDDSGSQDAVVFASSAAVKIKGPRQQVDQDALHQDPVVQSFLTIANRQSTNFTGGPQPRYQGNLPRGPPSVLLKG